MAFTKGLTIPAFDDSRLDDSFDSSLSNNKELSKDNGTPDDVLDIEHDSDDDSSGPVRDDLNTTARQSDLTESSMPESRSSMHFISTHFKDSDSDADEESLTKGLDFPDIEDALKEADQEKTTLEKAAEAIASERLTQTMGGLMASTMFGLSKIGETVRGVASSIQPNSGSGVTDTQVEYVKQESASTSDESETVTFKQTEPEASVGLTESTDADILAEFEFLEEAELESYDGSGQTKED